MKIVIQRCASSSLSVDKELYSSIGAGMMVLVGVECADTVADANYLIGKLTALRIFDDPGGVMNLSIEQTGGDVMVVSQFTLQASTRKGARPSYIAAARPEQALPLYEYFVAQLKERLGREVATGKFGANMLISLVNDGPVTIIIDSKNK